MRALLALLALGTAPPVLASPTSLERGTKALADFRAEEALTLFEKALGEGPYARPEHIQLYEQLGISYAYLDRAEDAGRAFDMLLALDPGRAISYTLSPKVTFLFEQARKRAGDALPPTVDVRWPSGLKVADPIPLDVEVIADPRSFLRRARLFFRVRGSPRYEAAELTLPAAPGRQVLTLPPPAAASAGPQVLELYLVGFDERGNEVYGWGTDVRPRELPLAFEPPEPWFEQWWIWAIAGSVVAVSASAAVFAATREPGPTVSGTFRVLPE